MTRRSRRKVTEWLSPATIITVALLALGGLARFQGVEETCRSAREKVNDKADKKDVDALKSQVDKNVEAIKNDHDLVVNAARDIGWIRSYLERQQRVADAGK